MRTTSPKQLLQGRKRGWETGDYLLPEEIAKNKINFAEIFPDNPDAPVEIEIGVGKGTFLLERSKENPHINFIGIEYSKPYAVYVADRFRRTGQKNVKMICCDAGPFMQNAIEDEALFRVHIYYPDPWPKKKHLRRRLIQPAYIQELRRVLKLGGQLFLVTDHRNYFEHMTRVITDVPGFARTNFPKLLNSDIHVVGTNFEKKYIEEGRNFYKAALLKYC